MKSLARTLLVSCLSITAACGVTYVQADNYPSKPITIMVGYPPGGSTDLTGRVVAGELAKNLGATVIVDNVGGAGGTIGAQKVVNAAPDGYTLLLGSNNELIVSRLISPAVKYRWQDFTPIGLVASQPMVLVANQKTGVKNTDQFIRLVKSKPGQFSFGSAGVGTALHLAGEMVKEQSGIFMTHIPYRGAAPLTSDLLGNNIEFAVYVLSSGLPYIKSGKVVALGTTAKMRSHASPDVPALAEHPLLKNMDISTWFALVGPAGMPKPIVAKLKKALNQSLQSPDLRKKLEDAGSTVAPLDVDMPKYLTEETSKYQKIVEFANIKE